MKGSVWIIVFALFAIVIALLVGAGVTVNLAGGGEGAIHKTSLQSNIYLMGHALDAARLYMETSLGYSLYQACHDNLARGGLASIPEDKGKSGYAYLPVMTEEQFLGELNLTALTYLNRYAGENYVFLSDYHVVMPAYTHLKITSGFDSSELVVSSMSLGKFTIIEAPDSEESITLRAASDVSVRRNIPCLSLYLEAKELNTGIDSDFQSDFSDSIDSLNTQILKVSCQDNILCSDQLTSTLRNLLEEKSPGPHGRGNYLITPGLLEVRVTVSRTDSGKITQYSARALQNVTLEENDATRTQFPVWNGSGLTFDSPRLIYLNRAETTEFLG